MKGSLDPAAAARRRIDLAEAERALVASRQAAAAADWVGAPWEAFAHCSARVTLLRRTVKPCPGAG